MTSPKWILSIGCISVFLSGCTAGSQHAYQYVVSDIQVSGGGSIAVATQDQRADIVTGEKKPNFVGGRRDRIGGAFDVTTDSGNPLASDMTKSISASFAKRGFKAVPIVVLPSDELSQAVSKLKGSGAERLLLLKLSKWNSDTATNTALVYKATAYVFDGSGKLLGEKQIDGRDNLGGSAWSPSAYAQKAVPVAVKQRLDALLNSKEILLSLE